MNLKKYDPETHAEEVPEFFSEQAVRPESFEEFRDAVDEALTDIEEVVGMDADFDVVIAATDIEKFDEETPPGLYFRGYSLGKDVHGHADRNKVFLAGPTDYEYWRPGVKNMAVHEEAHQEFFQRITDLDHVIWESMVLEGHALLREKTVREERDYEWSGDPRSYDGSAQEVIEELDKNREWQGEKYDRDNTSSLFSMESDWEGIGYVIAREVYSDMVKRNGMEIDEPLTQEKDWLRAEVEKSIENLYD
ncbi:MAG: hypothetical protein ABEK04_05225 [Candidatus Nanohalobium sp.]